jgi:hypothetical protein
MRYVSKPAGILSKRGEDRRVTGSALCAAGGSYPGALAVPVVVYREAGFKRQLPGLIQLRLAADEVAGPWGLKQWCVVPLKKHASGAFKPHRAVLEVSGLKP